MRKLILIGLVFGLTALNAQYIKPYFNTLSVENGLPEGYVVSSLQDKLGYMWLGTQNGLVRYNGYELKSYPFSDEDGLPIVNSSIGTLHEDDNQNLWVTDRSHGLYYLDRQKDAFVKIPLDSTGRHAFLDHDVVHWLEDKKNDSHWFIALNISTNVPSVFAWNETLNKFEKYSSFAEVANFIWSHRNQYLIQSGDGKIWLAGDSLLSYFDSSSKSFKPWFIIPDNERNMMISGVTTDPTNKDRLWVSTHIPGDDIVANPGEIEIFHISTKTKEYQSYKHIKNDPGTIAGNCRFIFNDSLGRTWFSTEKGISLFNYESGTFKNYSVNIPTGYATNGSVISMTAADKEGNLWMAGSFNGLLYLDIETSKTTFFSHSNAPGSLPDSPRGTNKLFYDRSGTLWASFPWRGIAYLDHQKSLLNPIPIQPESLGVNGVIREENIYISGKKNDSVFFVDNNAGLFEWNYKQDSFERIDLKNNKVYGQITNTYVTRDGLIWIGSGMGLFAYDPAKKSVKKFAHDPNDSTSISSNYITKITEDNEGNLWIGTSDRGLCLLNRKESKFTSFPFITNNRTIKVDNELDDARVLSMRVDEDKIVWIGTNRGALNKFDPGAQEFNSFLDPKQGFYCVASIFEDSRKRMWNGSYLSGLFLIDTETGYKKRYSTQNGLIHNSVFGISEDNEGNIWIASFRGLSRLNPESDHITNFRFSIGDLRDPNILFTDSDGWLQLAIENGLITFDPEKLTASPVPPATVIESVSYRNDMNRDTIVFAYGKSQLELRYNENKVSFQYVCLHYANAEQNQYAYKLDGYDKEWIKAGTQRSATYTNLSPGKYTFSVKSANSDGVWNETVQSISIRISPPWWLTWWAYAVYGLMFIAIVIAIDGIQRRRLAEKANQKAKEKELEQAREIEKAYNKLKATQSQLIQSEKMASLGELTAGIAHEIQNPLNFVNNFSEVSGELIDEMIEELEKGEVEEAKEIAADIKLNLEKITLLTD